MKNILWLFCDELRCDALGVYDGIFRESLTPNVDRIGRKGTVFTNCFCSSPLCVPARASIMTGCSPLALDVLSNEAAFPGYSFQKRVTTIPQEFEKAGYETASFGKTHLPTGMHPFMLDDGSGGEMGFDRGLAVMSPKGCSTVIGGVYPKEKPFPPERVTERALQYLDRVEKPFFMRVSFLQPHTPVVVPQTLTEEFRDLEIPAVRREPPHTSRFERRFAEIVDSRNLSEEEVVLCRKYYYLLVHWVDIQIGKIIKKLKERDLYDNTVLVFHADHGASLGEHGLFAKHIFAPNVHRVPLIISDIDRTGKESGVLCSGTDLAGTLSHLAGIPVNRQFQGINLWSAEEREYLISAVGYGNADSKAFPYKNLGVYDEKSGWPMRACIRTKTCRLDKNVRINGKKAEGQEDMFFCCSAEDKEEQINRIKDAGYGKTAERLREILDGELAQYGL